MARPGAEANVDGDRTILGRISRMRCTDRKLTPTAFANRRPVQSSLLAAADQVPGDFGAPNMLLRRVVIAENKLTAIGVTFTTFLLS